MIVELTDGKIENELLSFLNNKGFQYKQISLYNKKLIIVFGKNEEEIFLNFPEQKIFRTGKKATLAGLDFKKEKTIL